MIVCKNCQSQDIRINSMNFASAKLEGQPFAKARERKNSFVCNDCEFSWETDDLVKRKSRSSGGWSGCVQGMETIRSCCADQDRHQVQT